jgi:hypothetical protein
MCFVNPPPPRRARVVRPFRYERSVLVTATPAELWSLLEQPTAYPGWWPWLDLDHREPALRAGSVVEATIRAPLPYRLDLRIRVHELRPGEAIHAEVAGDLAGRASVELVEHPAGTLARLSWQLDVTGRVLRALAAVARPALEWGHDRVVADGVAQFARATGVAAHLQAGDAPTGRARPAPHDGLAAPLATVDPPPVPMMAGLAAGPAGTRPDDPGPGVVRWLVDGAAAAFVAGALSGGPSTLHALASGASPMAAARAAGEVLGRPGLARGAVAHALVSLSWATLLAAVLPRRRTVAAGAAAGLAIAALDLGIVARVVAPRRLRGIRSLPTGPQVADHVAFGALAGAVVAHRRRTRTLGARPA